MNFLPRSLIIWLAGPFLVCLATAAQPPFPYHFSFDGGDVFAFLGDQITSEGSYSQYVENYFLTRYPDRAVLFHNAGCANDTVADALERLQADVVDRSVTYLFVLLGSWDGAFAGYSDALFHAYQANYGELLDRLHQAKVHPFLVSPPMFDELVREQRRSDESFRFRNRFMTPHYNGVMALYGAWLREEAVRRNLRFIDVWGPLNAFTSEERRINSSFSLVPDALQPDEGGHAIMAASLIESLALERDSLGSITLEHTGGNPPWHLRSSQGGMLSQLAGSEDGVSFLWKPRSLPWAFPDSAMIAVQLARIEERCNREVLHLIGLRAGDYELIIGGERMPGTFSHVQLAKGLELHGIPERPGQAQARRVAEGNLQRHAESVRPLRELWEQLKRTRQGFPADDARCLHALADLSPRMETLRQQASDRLTALYGEAKPLARNFELRRIPTEAELKAQSPPPAQEEPLTPKE